MSASKATIDAPSIVDVAKASIIAYGKKDWDAVKAALTPDIVYDEVATNRKAKGLDDVLPIWKGWASAFPDSKAEFGNALASGNTVVVELTWRGTHTGAMPMPSGTIAPTGKKIEFRAVQLIEVAGGKTKSIRQYFDMATMLKQLGVGG
ncbi:MAG TPA: ester cyclase [Gemmatimonadaceae bacterium]|nr:ester cyclase [Gemmatimonadaceae bacterium]